jgi:NADPH:quinone reductase
LAAGQQHAFAVRAVDTQRIKDPNPVPRIVGRKPKSLSFEEAAAMPLTTTAVVALWEALYDRLGLRSDIKRKTISPEISTSDDSDKKHSPSSILIICGAGGVGSIAIQLAML